LGFLSWYQQGFWFTQGNGVLMAVEEAKCFGYRVKLDEGNDKSHLRKMHSLATLHRPFLPLQHPMQKKKNFEIGKVKSEETYKECCHGSYGA
jgi:hypothetical protein